MSTPSPESRTCAFCGRSVGQWLEVERFSAHACQPCAVRLGRILVSAPEALVGVWPVLHEVDDGEPEPKVRLSDGRSVELRQHTAELKKELTVDKRLELAHTYGELGLHREQLLECGHVLSVEPPIELAQSALNLLVGHRFTARDALSRLRVALFPG